MDREPERSIAAMAAVIRDDTAPTAVRADYERWLRAHGVADADVHTLLQTGGQRLLVYRALVHNRLIGAIREFVPRTAARRGREPLRSDFAAFMVQQAPTSPYLRDVPGEFVAWIRPRWRDDPDVPPWLADLATHELLEMDVRNDPRGGEPPTGRDIALDRPLSFDGTARLLHYDFAVQRLPRAEDDRTEPTRERSDLLVFRDTRNKVRYLELTAWAAVVLAELLGARKPVAEGLHHAAAAIGEPLDDDKLAKSAVLFGELLEAGVLLGASR